MGGKKEHNDQRSGEKAVRPTASFDGSSLGPGGQVGPFRIERELGRGAVGVVYLAHDTKLDRSVAIKSLPAEVMDNPKVRSRFSREARLLASVNHPNIATIHEVLEEAEGVGYLILEYVPGQTLAERIAGARLKLQEALTIARQMAEAVAAAHEHDVIHRDLKPGNIKITPKGQVKVLDFGLAKAVGGEAADQQSTVTEPGRIIGTPAYMSPEQARDMPTDKRSDIWSFGCVLYEMLTATVPFEGRTMSDTLANILQTEPNWETLPRSTPANIRVLLRRCLEKDPRRRLQHIGDAGLEISEALAQPVTVSVKSETPRRASWKVAVGVLAGLALGALIMLVAGEMATKESSPSEPKLVVRSSIILDPNNPVAMWSLPAFTPDGRELIYVAGHAGGDTWLAARPLHSSRVRRIEGTDGASFWPQVSPDGRWLAFMAHRAIWMVPVTGGNPQQITKTMFCPYHVWEDEDTLILGTRVFSKDGLSRLDLRAEESEPEPLTTLNSMPGYVAHMPYHFDPLSRTLIFGAVKEASAEHDLFGLSLQTGKPKLLVKNAVGTYAPSGHLIYVYTKSSAFMAVPFDIRALQRTGPAVNVTEERMPTDWIGTMFSRQGTLVYIPTETRQASTRDLVWVDLDGHEEPLDARPMLYNWVRASAAATTWQIAAHVYDAAIAPGYERIWICTPNSENSMFSVTFPTSEGDCFRPVWIPPDNNEIAFNSIDPNGFQLKRKKIDGSDDAETILFKPSERWVYYNSCTCTPDGKGLLAAARAARKSASDVDIVLIDLEGFGEVRPLLSSEYNEHSPAISPDGKFLAYVSDEMGRDDVFVKTYPDLKGKRQLSTETEGGREPIWAPDSTAIYYRDGTSVVEVPVTREGGFTLGRAKELFEDKYVAGGQYRYRNYDIDPSGKRFLMIKESEDNVPMTEFVIVQNWFEVLKAKSQ